MLRDYYHLFSLINPLLFSLFLTHTHTHTFPENIDIMHMLKKTTTNKRKGKLIMPSTKKFKNEKQ